MADLTLADLLLKLLAEWRNITQPRQRELLKLTSDKAAQLETTHLDFIRMLRELSDLVDRAAKDGGRSNEDLSDLLRKLDGVRHEGRQYRLAQYEQARVFADRVARDETTVLKAVPADVIEAVKTAMRAYADYFETDRLYAHELGHVFNRLHITFKRAAADPAGAPNLWSGANARIAEAVKILEQSWIRFSRAYATALVAFGAHGITNQSAK